MDVFYAFIVLIAGITITFYRYKYVLLFFYLLLFLHISLSIGGKNVPSSVLFLIGVIFAFINKELILNRISDIVKFLWYNTIFLLFAFLWFGIIKFLSKNDTNYQILKFILILFTYFNFFYIFKIFKNKEPEYFLFFLKTLKKISVFIAILCIFQFLFQLDLSQFYIKYHWILPNVSTIDAFHLSEAPNLYTEILGLKIMRYTAFFTKPNAIACILTLSFAILAVNKQLSKLEALLLYLTILLSFVRIAQIGATIVFILYYETSRLKKILVSGISILLFLTVIFLRTGNFSIYDIKSDSIRILFWSKAVKTISDNTLGIGLGNTPKFIEQEFPIYLSHYSHIHNTILQLLLELGSIKFLILMSLFILLLVTLFFSLKSKKTVNFSFFSNKKFFVPTIIMFLFYNVDLYFFGVDYLTLLYLTYVSLLTNKGIKNLNYKLGVSKL